jgi:hypothetical protein
MGGFIFHLLARSNQTLHNIPDDLKQQLLYNYVVKL